MIKEDTDELQPVDLLTARMKSIGAQWLVNMTDHFSNSPDIIVNGFMASGFTQSINNGVLFINEDETHQESNGTDSDNDDDIEITD